MDFSVIANNFKFLIVQGLIGIGPFIGGTLRLPHLNPQTQEFTLG